MLKELKVIDMIGLQKGLNDSTNTHRWIFGVNHLDRVVNWLRCIHMETSELLDSYPWKHWKNINGKADLDNAKVEITDVWHFLLSYGMHSHFMLELFLLRKEIELAATVTVKDDLYPSKILDVVKFNELIEANEYSSLLKALESDFTFDMNVDEDECNKFFENVVIEKVTSKIMNRVDNNYSKKDDIYNKFEIMAAEAINGSIIESDEFDVKDGLNVFSRKIMTFDNILSIFFNIISSDVKFDLVKFYFGKNVLNKFRQDNGYKEGTYVKVWNGKEDNVYMLEAIADIPTDEVNFQVIYNLLEKTYKEL